MTDERPIEIRRHLENRDPNELAIVSPQVLEELIRHIDRLQARIKELEEKDRKFDWREWV